MGLLKNFALKNKLVYFIIAALLFIKCRPYFVWNMPEIYNISVSLLFSVLTCFFIDLKDNRRQLAFIVLLFAYILLSIFRGARFGAILNLSLAFIPFIKSESFLRIYDSFKTILSIVFFISILSSISVLLGIQFPRGVLDPINDVKLYGYLEYIMLIVPTNVEDLMPRFCAVFDEPGVVGTMCGMFVIAEKFKFSDWRIYVIFIAGLLSFSLYLYLILGAFLFFKSSTKYKIFIITLIIALYGVTKDNEIFHDRIWGRLEFEDGKMVGNNRNSDDFMRVWDVYKYSPKIIKGYGFKMAEEFNESSSIQLFIFRDGLLFVILFFVSILIYIRSFISSKYSMCMVFGVIFLTLYQRPGFCEADFIFLFTAIIINYSNYASLNSRSVI